MQSVAFKEVDLSFLDILPVVSTFSNLVYLFLKYTSPWLPEIVTRSRCWTYIETKDKVRCCIAMVPIVGNIICLLMNNDDWHAKNYELYQQLIEESLGRAEEAQLNTQRALSLVEYLKYERDKAVASLLVWQLVDEFRARNFIYKRGVYF